MYFIRSRSVVLETATANNVVLFIRSLSTALVTPGMSASGKTLCARKKTSLLYPGRFPLVAVEYVSIKKGQCRAGVAGTARVLSSGHLDVE